MIFAIHLALAGVTLQYIHNPFLLIATNVILHLILDAIPHADWATFRSNTTIVVASSITDFVLSLFFVWLVFANTNQPAPLIVATIAASSWLDLLDRAAKKFWPRLWEFHIFLHSWPASPKTPIDWSISLTGRTPLWVKLLVTAAILVGSYLAIAK